jgi:hypothetical protein
MLMFRQSDQCLAPEGATFVAKISARAALGIGGIRPCSGEQDRELPDAFDDTRSHETHLQPYGEQQVNVRFFGEFPAETLQPTPSLTARNVHLSRRQGFVIS